MYFAYVLNIASMFLLAFWITSSVVHKGRDLGRIFGLGLAYAVIAGFPALLISLSFRLLLGAEWSLLPAGIAFTGAGLVARRLCKAHLKGANNSFAIAAQAILLRIAKALSAASRGSVAVGVIVVCALAIVSIQQWGRWSDGQYRIAGEVMGLGYVSPEQQSILLHTTVRPITLIPVSGKDPERLCTRAHPYAASLIGDSGSTNWILLRTIHKPKWRVIALSGSDYAIELTPASIVQAGGQRRSSSGSNIPWDTPACVLR
ncbi:hypothetical protein NUM_05730 [Actinocatenispora comari]|uniref:Uncharacterized protein n=2 Tax=Actinocatenispora comari TaxID=2807577 RepID=A0A8J4A6S1_9ACTN|nr:hypothetical protein NUM_05730 [Actinocatenispora comari]